MSAQEPAGAGAAPGAQSTISPPPPAATLPAPPRPRYRAILRGFMILCILHAVINYGLWRPLTTPGVDYGKHWDAARAVLEGRSVYLGDDLWIGFNYPQASALAFAWIGWFDKDRAETVWKMTLLALLVATAWMAGRWYKPGPLADSPPAPPLTPLGRLARAGGARMWPLVTAFIVSQFLPATSSLRIGNVDPINAFFAVAMIAALLSGAERRAGALWAGLVLVKMVPLALLIPFIAWRRWRILQGFALVMAVYFVILLATGRVGEEWYFVREMMPAVPRWWRSISISPTMLFMRAIGQGEFADDPYGFTTVMHLSTLLWGGLYFALIAGLRRRGAPWERALEAAIVFYPILSPLLEYHHFVWLLPALFLQARRWCAGAMSDAMGLALLGAWLLLNAGYHSSFLYSMLGGWVHFGAVPGYLAVLLLTLWDCRPAAWSVAPAAPARAPQTALA